MSATVVHHRVERGERRKEKGKAQLKKTQTLPSRLFTLSLPVFPVLPVLWKRPPDEGGALSDSREEAQPRL